MSEFLWAMLASRFAEVIWLVEEVAFQRVDKRTADYLVRAADADGIIKKTPGYCSRYRNFPRGDQPDFERIRAQRISHPCKRRNSRRGP